MPVRDLGQARACPTPLRDNPSSAAKASVLKTPEVFEEKKLKLNGVDPRKFLQDIRTPGSNCAPSPASPQRDWPPAAPVELRTNSVCWGNSPLPRHCRAAQDAMFPAPANHPIFNRLCRSLRLAPIHVEGLLLMIKNNQRLIEYL